MSRIYYSGEKNPNFKHGLTSGHEHSGIYNTWMNMKGRCMRSTHPKYSRYGGRGIKIFQEWLDINIFYKWALDNGWFKGASIDRKDNDGDYCPENCHWISMSENSRKKRTTKISLEQAAEIRKRLDSGENAYDLAKEYGVVHGTIWFIQKNFTHVAEGECTKKLKENREKNA